MADHVELATLIRFQVAQLGAHNAHHGFEDMCFHLAKAIITPDLVYGTGPVSAGGDQGRDFETFRGRRGEEDLAFACTIQRDDLPKKIRADVEKATSKGENVDAVVVMCAADLPIAKRHALQDEIRRDFNVRLEVLDGQTISDKLAEIDNFWLARRYLDIPEELAPAAPDPGRAELERREASRLFTERLEALPAPVAELLAVEQTYRVQAERLVDGIVRGDPQAVIRSWCANRPGWIQDAPAVILLALGQLAQAYGLRGEASELFEQAADLGFEPSRSYVRAAMDAAATDQPERTQQLFDKARAADNSDLVRAMSAGLGQDWATVLSTIDEDAALADPLLAHAYVAALKGTTKDDAIITFLTRFVERHEHHAGLALVLAGLLTERSTKPNTVSRQRDQQDALEIAVRARDSRPRWRGDSVEAVIVACTAAMVAGNLAAVIRLGSPAPHGDALAGEAADPEVQFCVASAAIGSGDLVAADRIASAASGFQQALIKADLLHASGAEHSDIDAQFDVAWGLVSSEDNKVALWLAASSAGVDPLPGADELATRSDDLPLLCQASFLIARGMNADAIDILRPHRQNERARRLLSDAYVRAGQIDDAVAELFDMARRFSNVDHALRAIGLLVGDDRIAEASEYATATLPLVRIGRTERSFLHEVGVAGSSHSGDWTEMERRVRSWMEEFQGTPRLRWLLVQAISNQADTDRAWQTLQADDPCEVERPLEAMMWIALHNRYQPGLESLRQTLHLASRFPGDNGVRAAAVNAFLLSGDAATGLTAGEIAHGRELVRDRADNPDPNDTFVAISVSDDQDELIASLRPMLEPQAQQVDEMLRRVRHDGWPYGVLSMAAGRPYTKTLVQRAAGHLPVASPDPSIVEAETRAAEQALAGGHVIVDLSAVVVGWYLQDLWSRLDGAFVTVGITEDSKRDAVISSDVGQPRATQVLSWDTAAGLPVIHDINDEDLDRIEAHVAWVIAQVSTLSIRPALPSPGRENDDDGRSDPWLTTIEAARASGLPLWSDDTGLRAVARQEGVAVFGTDALVYALRAVGRMTEDDVAGAITVLRNEYCTDFPIDVPWLLAAAERVKWRGGPALLAIGRPSTWSDLPKAYGAWGDIVEAAAASDVTLVPPWIYSATIAIGKAVGDVAAAVQLTAALLVQIARVTNGDPITFAASAQGAAHAAAEVGMPDPTELALSILVDLSSQAAGPDVAAAALNLLGSELTDEHREALRRVLEGD